MDENFEALRARVEGLSEPERKLLLAYLLGYATDAVQHALAWMDDMSDPAPVAVAGNNHGDPLPAAASDA